MRKVFFIVNPTANSGKAVSVWSRARQYLDGRNLPYTFALSKDGDDVARLAREAGDADVVAAVGGDGTVSRVAGALAGTETAIAVLPGGTGNDFARTFSVPITPEGACELIYRGERAPLDLGYLDSGCFCNVAGAGLDAEVVSEANKTFKKFSGSGGYLLALLKQLALYKPQPARITVDEHTLEAKIWLVAVANGQYYGGGMKIAPQADPKDGLADVVLVGDLHRLHFLRLFPLVYSGRHVFHPAVRVVKGKHVRVDCEKPLSVHADGDIIGRTPFHAGIQSQAVLAILPKRE